MSKKPAAYFSVSGVTARVAQKTAAVENAWVARFPKPTSRSGRRG